MCITGKPRAIIMEKIFPITYNRACHLESFETLANRMCRFITLINSKLKSLVSTKHFRKLQITVNTKPVILG